MSATLQRGVSAAPTRARKAVTTRTQTINIRVQAQLMNLIDQAADTLGQSRSAFMLERSVKAAEAVLLDQRLFVVDAATYEAFEAALDAPVQHNPKLAALLKKRAPWDK